jgi:hypothetical protein
MEGKNYENATIYENASQNRNRYPITDAGRSWGRPVARLSTRRRIPFGPRSHGLTRSKMTLPALTRTNPTRTCLALILLKHHSLTVNSGGSLPHTRPFRADKEEAMKTATFVNLEVPTVIAVLGMATLLCTTGRAGENPPRRFPYTTGSSFETTCSRERLLEILFEFEHVQKYMTGVDHLEQISKAPLRYDVVYHYSYLGYRSRLVFKKALSVKKQRITFHLLDSWDNVDFLPELLAVDGYYQIKPLGSGRMTVTYRQTSLFAGPLGYIYRTILKHRTRKFMASLIAYIEEEK